MFDAIKKALGVIAPTLATALGGTLAGAAVVAIGNAIGVPSGDPQDVLNKLNQMTPEQQLAIQTADQQFKLETQRMAYSDVADARNREVQLANTKWGWMSLSIQSLGALVILIVFIMLNVYGLFMNGVDPQNQSQIITSDIAIVMLLVGYWWGKSKSDD